MSTIVFCVHPITGSINATLKLARQLTEAGHCIYYLGVPDCEEFVVSHGYNFISVFSDTFPKGFFDENKDSENKNFIQTLIDIRKILKKIKNFILELKSGGDKQFIDAIYKIQAKLIIVVATHYDSFIWALLSQKNNIKCIYLHDTLCQSYKTGFPPITTGIIPRNKKLTTLKIFIAWKLHFLRRLIDNHILSMGVNLTSKRFIKKIAEELNYRVEDVDLDTDMLAPKLKLSELVLCPNEFEFPRKMNDPNRHYVEPSIDIDRLEIDFPWARVNESLPLIYCALGSLNVLSSSKYEDFFYAVKNVAEKNAAYQWIVSTGAANFKINLSEMPRNLVIVKKAPQISILRKAFLMINHGGTNTIKECMYFGVPMIAFPVGFDTYGNTARVVFHGLGIKGDIKKITPGYLDSLFLEITENDHYRIQAQAMKKVCIEKENAQLAKKFIESIIA